MIDEGTAGEPQNILLRLKVFPKKNLRRKNKFFFAKTQRSGKSCSTVFTFVNLKEALSHSSEVSLVLGKVRGECKVNPSDFEQHTSLVQ